MNYFYDKSQLTVDDVSLNLIAIIPLLCAIVAVRSGNHPSCSEHNLENTQNIISGVHWKFTTWND